MGQPGDGYSDVLRMVLDEHLPAYRFEHAVPLGEGLDNVAFLINDELVVRFGKQEDPTLRAETLAREVDVLAAVAAICPVPVPRTVFAVPEHGCLAYFMLRGELAGGVACIDLMAVAGRLGEVLRALHAAPVAPLAELVDADDFLPAEWLAEAAQCYADIGDGVPAAARGAVEEFLAAEPPGAAARTVFSHNDLGCEHVLIDPATSTVTGIIDWGDAAIVDPAYDYGLVHRDLGPAGLEAALRGHPGDVAELRERAVFYARCAALEDLAFGLETGREEFTARAVTAIDRVFGN